MKISPVSGPGAIPQNGTPESVRTAKAVAAFQKGVSSYDKAPTQGQAQEHPVQNANAISAEELGAIRQQAAATPEQQQQEETQQDQDTSTISEDTKVEAKKTEDPALSRQFAQLARQERALRAKAQQQQEQIKAERAALEAEKAAIAAKAKDYESGYISRDALKQNLVGILNQELGPSWYEEATQRVMNAQPVDPQVQATINELKAQVNALKQANEESVKSTQQRAQEQYKAALTQIELDAQSLVKSDPVTYEAVSKMGKSAIKEVVKLIEDTYNKDGVLMSVEEAAQEVENYLVEENYKMATNISKIKARIAKAGQPQQSAVKQPATNTQQQQPQMKTLTNATASTRKLSAKERAILAFKGELK